MSRRQEHNSRLAVPDTRRDKAAALRHTGKVPLEEEEDDPVEKAEWSSEGNQLSAVDAWGGDAWQERLPTLHIVVCNFASSPMHNLISVQWWCLDGRATVLSRQGNHPHSGSRSHPCATSVQ